METLKGKKSLERDAVPPHSEDKEAHPKGRSLDH